MIIQVKNDITFQVEQSPSDMMWYVSAYNQTGGREFRSWWGTATKENAMLQFWTSFDVLIYDHETHATYDKDTFVGKRAGYIMKKFTRSGLTLALGLGLALGLASAWITLMWQRDFNMVVLNFFIGWGLGFGVIAILEKNRKMKS